MLVTANVNDKEVQATRRTVARAGQLRNDVGDTASVAARLGADVRSCLVKRSGVTRSWSYTCESLRRENARLHGEITVNDLKACFSTFETGEIDATS